MIPTRYDRRTNAERPDDEVNRPRRQVWLALGVILVALLAVLATLWILSDAPVQTAALGFL